MYCASSSRPALRCATTPTNSKSGTTHFTTRSPVLEHDPEWSVHEHPGLFVFRASGKTACITGDGRALDGSGHKGWERYMTGDSISVLAKWFAARLDI